MYFKRNFSINFKKLRFFIKLLFCSFNYAISAIKRATKTEGTIMINRIKIENFKSIQKLAIRLRPINILIGANGVGKSNFIEISLPLLVF